MPVWKNSRNRPGTQTFNADLLAHALGMEPGTLVNEAAKAMSVQQEPMVPVE